MPAFENMRENDRPTVAEIRAEFDAMEARIRAEFAGHIETLKGLLSPKPPEAPAQSTPDGHDG